VMDRVEDAYARALGQPRAGLGEALA